MRVSVLKVNDYMLKQVIRLQIALRIVNRLFQRHDVALGA